MTQTDRKIQVAIFNTMCKPPRRIVVETIDVPASALTRGQTGEALWKAAAREIASNYGLRAHTVCVCHRTDDQPYDVSVAGIPFSHSLVDAATAVVGKPVTRGGQPIGRRP